jgi:hypothetical protein
MPNMRSAKLARWQIWLLTISGSLLWLSGGAWLLLHYYGQVEGEFGLETNPFETWSLRLHGLFLIPALLGFGGLFVVHMPKGWKNTYQRNIGLALTVLLAVLILSGYLLYYVGDDGLRSWSSIIHWVIGLATPIFFIWHYLGHNPKVARRKRERPDAS